VIREQPFLFAELPWVSVRDGDTTAAALFDRHYSRNPGSVGDARVAGPGTKTRRLLILEATPAEVEP
jgi:hypothetical protein